MFGVALSSNEMHKVVLLCSRSIVSHSHVAYIEILLTSGWVAAPLPITMRYVIALGLTSRNATTIGQLRESQSGSTGLELTRVFALALTPELPRPTRRPSSFTLFHNASLASPLINSTSIASSSERQ